MDAGAKCVADKPHAHIARQPINTSFGEAIYTIHLKPICDIECGRAGRAYREPNRVSGDERALCDGLLLILSRKFIAQRVFFRTNKYTAIRRVTAPCIDEVRYMARIYNPISWHEGIVHE